MTKIVYFKSIITIIIFIAIATIIKLMVTKVIAATTTITVKEIAKFTDLLTTITREYFLNYFNYFIFWIYRNLQQNL